MNDGDVSIVKWLKEWMNEFVGKIKKKKKRILQHFSSLIQSKLNSPLKKSLIWNKLQTSITLEKSSMKRSSIKGLWYSYYLLNWNERGNWNYLK